MKKTMIILIASMLVIATPAFALFTKPDKTPASTVVATAWNTSGSTANDAIKTAADKITEAAGKIAENGSASKKESQDVIKAAAMITKYSDAVKDNDRLHFGIAGGVTYQLDNEVGVEADLYVRKRSAFLLTGVQYSPAKALVQWDNSNMRFHAVVGWEF